MTDIHTPEEGFAATGLAPGIVGILTRHGFTRPTPIQQQAIPVAREGGDLIGIAQTGTGKTLAFGLPIIEKLQAHPGRALIVVPTRELALQVQESIDRVGRAMRPSLPSVCLIGGMPIHRQIADLRRSPRILVATPGRLIDHLEQRTVDLSDVGTLVLDEADRMLDMGFAPQIKRILTSLPVERQTMLFSATMPAEIEELAARYLRTPERVEIARPGTGNSQIRQELCYVQPENKVDLLKRLLAQHGGTVLVFSRTKHGARKLTRQVQGMGHSAAEIHSNRTLAQRREALDGFKGGRYRVLVATDIAARGIDVKEIALVINFDLPEVAEDYVHRIGRTGRAGRGGLAISFATHEQYRDIKAIERLIDRAVPLGEHSEQPRVIVASPTRSARSSFTRQNPARPAAKRRQGVPGRPTGWKPVAGSTKPTFVG